MWAAGAALVLVLVGAPAGASVDASVQIANLRFSPSSVTIQAGETVTWSHADGSTPHSVTGSGFNSSPGCTTTNLDACMHGGDSYSHTFSSAGTFPYVCNVHSNMTGTIVVEAPPPPPPTTTTTTAPPPPPTTTTAPPRTTTTAPRTTTTAPRATTTTGSTTTTTSASTTTAPSTTTTADRTTTTRRSATSTTEAELAVAERDDTGGGGGGFPWWLLLAVVAVGLIAGGVRAAVRSRAG